MSDHNVIDLSTFSPSSIVRKDRVHYTQGLSSAAPATEWNHVLNKGQTESLIAGLGLTKTGVAIAYDANVDIATGGQVAEDWVDSDGLSQSYTPDIGARALLIGQTDASENGIYTVNAGAWTRTEDADESSELPAGASVKVLNGEFANQRYDLVESNPNVGVDDITFIRHKGGSGSAVDIGFDSTGTSLTTGDNVQDAIATLDFTVTLMDAGQTAALNSLAQTLGDADTVLANAINTLDTDLTANINQLNNELQAEIVAGNDADTQLATDLNTESVARQDGDNAILNTIALMRQNVNESVIAAGQSLPVQLIDTVAPASVTVYQVVGDELVDVTETIERRLVKVGGAVTTLELKNASDVDITVEAVIKY